MNIQEKVEQAKQIIKNIATHDDSDPTEVFRGLRELQDFIQGDAVQLADERDQRIDQRAADRQERERIAQENAAADAAKAEEA